MTNVTKGPWVLRTSINGVIEVVGANGETICDNYEYYPHPISKENAPMLAAAWDLHEALEVFAKLADDLDGSPSDGVERTPDDEWVKFRLLAQDYRKARAAIKKARGE